MPTSQDMVIFVLTTTTTTQLITLPLVHACRVKSTQTRFARDNRNTIHPYTLTFLDYYAPIIIDVLSEVCGRHSGCSLVATMVGWSV